MAGRTRICCPGVRYVELGVDFEIEKVICRQHASYEFGGACNTAHQEQCQTYSPILFAEYGETFKKRAKLPVIANTLQALRREIALSIYTSMEVRSKKLL